MITYEFDSYGVKEVDRIEEVRIVEMEGVDEMVEVELLKWKV